MSRFWPIVDAGQADYQRLRDAVLATGRLPDDLTAARFRRRGVVGLVAWPTAEPVFVAELVGAARPAWSPYTDPRIEALANVYRLLVRDADPDRTGAAQGSLMTSGGQT